MVPRRETRNETIRYTRQGSHTPLPAQLDQGLFIQTGDPSSYSHRRFVLEGCKIPFCGSLGVGARQLNCSPNRNLSQLPGQLPDPRAGRATWVGFCFVDFTQLSRHRTSGLSSYQLFGDINRHQSRHPLPRCPSSKMVELSVEFALASDF